MRRKYLQVSLIQMLLLVVTLLPLWSVVFTVDERELAVVTRMGQVVHEIRDPGPYFKIPLIDTVYRMEKRAIPFDIRPYEAQTKDRRIVIFDYGTLMRVQGPAKFLTSVRSIELATNRVDAAIYTAARNRIGSLDYAELLSGNRGELETAILSEANLSTAEFGVSVERIRIVRIDLPAENQQAVYGRMNAERNAIAAQYRAEGELNRDRIKATADRDARTTQAEAREKAEGIRGEGDAIAARLFSDAYSGEATEFYRLFRGAEVARETFIKGTRIFLTGKESHLADLLSSTPPRQ